MSFWTISYKLTLLKGEISSHIKKAFDEQILKIVVAPPTFHRNTMSSDKDLTQYTDKNGSNYSSSK